MKIPILKKLVAICLFLAIVFIAEGQEELSAVTVENSEEKPALHILYVDPLYALLYDKIGLIYSYKKKNIDFQCYGNFIYGGGLFNDTPFYSSSVRILTFQDRSPDEGFELGAQIRIPFKRNWQSQPFAAFIKEKGKVDFFGVWGELAFKKGDISYRNSFERINTQNITVGVITGWTNTSGKIASDFYAGVGIGRAFAKLLYTEQGNVQTENAFLFVLRVGMRFGAKLN